MRLSIKSIFVSIALTGIFAATDIPGHQARADVLQSGQLAVTGFSGARVEPNNAAPIDVDAAALRILDVSQRSVGADATISAATVFAVKAGDIGQVFAIAFDDGQGPDGRGRAAPNLYAAATSAYGLRIIEKTPGAEASPVELARGGPNAQWMPGLFGTAKGGGPGSIWKIDGRTGEVSLFADVQAFGATNSGPGLGGLAFDPASRMIYVSDLQSGLIHRFDLNGADLGVFDHGVDGRPAAQFPVLPRETAGRSDITDPAFDAKDPASWGYAPFGRLIHALAVHRGRLYYAVAEGPQIWSIGLNTDGSFAGDARPEILQTGTSADADITGIAFDQAGRLYVSERSRFNLQQPAQTINPSALRRFELMQSADGAGQYWALMPGVVPTEKFAAGGVTFGFGYTPDGRLDMQACGGTVWTTSTPAPSSADASPGLIGEAAGEAHAPDQQPLFISHDSGSDKILPFSLLGAVAAYSPCGSAYAHSGQTGQPGADSASAAKGPLLFVETTCKPCPTGGDCSCRLTLTNKGRSAATDSVGLTSSAVVLSGPQSGELKTIRDVFPDSKHWLCKTLSNGRAECLLDGAALPPGGRRAVDIAIGTNDLVQAGSAGVRVCTRLLLSGGEAFGQEACAETGVDLRVTETGAMECLAGQPCLSATTITNISNTAFEGDIKLTQFTRVPGKGDVPGAISINPPLDCKPEAGAASPYECRARMTLEAGESRLFEVTTIYSGGGATAPANAVTCAAATDLIVDINRLLPGLPPAPMSGPGYSCRSITLWPEGALAALEPPNQSGSGTGAGAGDGNGTAPGQTQPGGQKAGEEAGLQQGHGQGSAGQDSGAAESGASQGGSGEGSSAPGGAGDAAGNDGDPAWTERICPGDTIEQGDQCVCARGAHWDGSQCSFQGGGGAGTARCADGSDWNGISCGPTEAGKSAQGAPDTPGAGPGSSGGFIPVSCKAPFVPSLKGCACADNTRWDGLSCVPQTDYDGPEQHASLGGGASEDPGADAGAAVSAGTPGAPAEEGPRITYGSGGGPAERDPRITYGSAAGPPCPEGQVRGKDGQCGCPPYLEAVVEAGKSLCCLVPCPSGTKRVNSQCVADIPPAAPPPAPEQPKGLQAEAPKAECLPGWTGVYPNCCEPGSQYVGGVCTARMAVVQPLQCPANYTGQHPICCEPGTVYQNGACLTLQPVSCGGGMTGTPPNCACPANMQLNGAQCAPILCPVGTSGIYPICCPPGAQYRGGACYGTRTVTHVADTPDCPKGTSGVYPKCCPKGMTYRRGACYGNEKATRDPVRCRPGYRLTRRGCRPVECPDGTYGTPPNCQEIARRDPGPEIRNVIEWNDRRRRRRQQEAEQRRRREIYRERRRNRGQANSQAQPAPAQTPTAPDTRFNYGSCSDCGPKQFQGPR